MESFRFGTQHTGQVAVIVVIQVNRALMKTHITMAPVKECGSLEKEHRSSSLEPNLCLPEKERKEAKINNYVNNIPP